MFIIPDKISVDYKVITKPNKSYSTQRDLYLSFLINENGIKRTGYCISTGITVDLKHYDRGTIKGSSSMLHRLRKSLNEMTAKADDLLLLLRTFKLKTYSELLQQLQINAREHILNKPARGKAKEYQSKMKQLTYEEVMTKCLEYHNPCAARRKKYLVPFKLFQKFFAEAGKELPYINEFDKQHLIDFKKWLKGRYPNTNTLNSYLNMIRCVFNYAHKHAELIDKYPVPPDFTSGWKDGKPKSLTAEEINAIINLRDSALTNTQQIGKYVAQFLFDTGMAYCDARSLRNEHIDYTKGFIEKSRTKTNQTFKVYLSNKGWDAIKKLKELSGHDATRPFNLPSIEYMTRLMKVIAVKAGIRDTVRNNISTYTFRHSFAIDRMNSGVPIEDIKLNLGHRNLSTTGIYAKVTDTRLAENQTRYEQRSKVVYKSPLTVAV